MIDTFVKWRIVDPRAFIRSVSGSEQVAVDRINRSLRDALNNEVARRTVADMISGEREKVVENVRAKVDEDSRQIGAEIIDVRLKRVDFAPEVSGARVRADGVRAQAGRQRAARHRAAESEKIRADADRQREVILAEAYRDAQRIKGEGRREVRRAVRFGVRPEPEFASFYRSLEAYRASFRTRSDLMVVDPRPTSSASSRRRATGRAERAETLDVTLHDWLRAIGLVLVIEGLMPLLAPARWREMFMQVARLRDGQIRFVGFGSALAGVVLLLMS